MTLKTIDTLVEDIYGVLLNGNHKVNADNLNQFSTNITKAVKETLEESGVPREAKLRMSVIGKPDRKLWYELKKSEPKVLDPSLYIKFLFGDFIEHLLVLLVKEAGHKVAHDQEELEIGGIVGHCDPVIDNVPVDIKSASKYSYNSKFVQGKLLKGDDPFGYVGQLSGYRQKLVELYPDEIVDDKIAWLVMNKETGELCLLVGDIFDIIDAEKRIEEVKEVLEHDTPPPTKCYPDVADGASGNRVLSKGCQWCPFKEDCWKDSNGGRGLRKFKYSNGLKYFTQVEKMPRVEEVT